MSLISRIITVLEEAGAPLRAPELAERIGAPVASVRATLSQAINEPQNAAASRVERIRHGVYALRKKATNLGLTWHEAVTLVLEENSEPMHYRDITDEIVSRGIAARVGVTPARTVAATLSANKDERFQVVERGVYMICEVDEDEEVDDEDEEVDDEDEDEDESTSTPQLRVVSYGMYWRRSAVVWSTTAHLLGVETYSQPEPIDFTEQRGLYLLHRGHQTVYVGKAIAQALGKRISDHTRDRLGGRWDSFSWLGFRELNTEGELEPLPSHFGMDAKQLISLMEFWLIEAVEPALNRKQGDAIGFSATEYLQRDDPDLEKAVKKKLVNELLSNI